MAGVPQIVAIVADPTARLRDLAREASAEGFAHVDRLLSEWADGRNRFDREGEALLAAELGGETIAIGGLTHDPHRAGALRVRRFYVSRTHRGTGIGRLLAQTILGQISGPQLVTAHAPNEDAIAFWRALGFTYREDPHHNLTLSVPAGETR